MARCWVDEEGSVQFLDHLHMTLMCLVSFLVVLISEPVRMLAVEDHVAVSPSLSGTYSPQVHLECRQDSWVRRTRLKVELHAPIEVRLRCTLQT